MTDADVRPDPAEQVAAMTRTPGGLLALAAVVFLIAYLVFEVLLGTFSFPTLGLVAAVLILVGRYRPAGAAAPLASNPAQFVLGLALFVEGISYLVFDVRGGYLDFGHIEDVVARVAHYAAGGIAGLGAYRLMR
jgi:hypothetical protein